MIGKEDFELLNVCGVFDRQRGLRQLGRETTNKIRIDCLHKESSPIHICLSQKLLKPNH